MTSASKLLAVTGQKTRDGQDKFAVFVDGLCYASGSFQAMEAVMKRLDPHYVTQAERFRQVNAHRNGMGVHS